MATTAPRRVYVAEVVDAYISELHAELADLRSQLSDHERSGLPPVDALTRLVNQAQEVVEAHRRVGDIIADAERRAEGLLTEATLRAQQLVAEAERHASQLLAEAERRRQLVAGGAESNGDASPDRVEAQRLIAEAHRIINELSTAAEATTPVPASGRAGKRRRRS